MSDQKISELPSATVVNSTDEFVINQAGVTKRAAKSLVTTATAGGDLTGTYPDPTLAAITTAQSNVGSSAAIPVLSVDAKGRVTALTTTALTALTTTQIAGLTTVQASVLATTGVAGISTFAARGDHQHPFPTAAQVGALGATASAGGDLTGNYPSPALAAITTAQTAVGSSSVIPVLSIDAKGRVTALTTAQLNALTTSQIAGIATNAPAALATAAVVGLSTFAAREDHQHLFPTTSDIGAVAKSGDTMTGRLKARVWMCFTMTGKLNTPAATTSSAGINIGNIAQTPTTQVSGDVWINGEVMAFRSATAQRNLVSTSVLASFTAGVSAAIGSAAVSALAVQQNGTGAAVTIGNVATSTSDCVTITNLGTGNSIVVNDETTPDSTRFAVANNGRVGIGVAPDASIALTLDTTGMRIGATGPTLTTGAGSPEGVVTAPIGSLYLNLSGGASTTLYVKTSGTGNTGWTAK